MRYRESEEMYLETILKLSEKNPNLRSVDIVEELNYAKSSVSRAVNLLKTQGYISIDNDGVIRLTEEGQNKAKSIYERHMILTKALMIMGASSSSAEENACRMEHVITDEVFEVFKSYVNNNQ